MENIITIDTDNIFDLEASMSTATSLFAERVQKAMERQDTDSVFVVSKTTYVRPKDISDPEFNHFFDEKIDRFGGYTFQETVALTDPAYRPSIAAKSAPVAAKIGLSVSLKREAYIDNKGLYHCIGLCTPQFRSGDRCVLLKPFIMRDMMLGPKMAHQVLTINVYTREEYLQLVKQATENFAANIAWVRSRGDGEAEEEEEAE